MLTIIGDAEHKVYSSGKKVKQVKVRCECGNEKIMRKDHVTSGMSNSCGCLRGTNPHKDKETSLTILEDAGYSTDRRGQRNKMVKVRCDCGTEKVLLKSGVATKRIRSCGCGQGNVKHRETLSRTYEIWCSMKKRCHDSNSKAYSNYGGRGISVCKEWSESYEAFRDWANASGYSDELSIDRIDNDGDYTPVNCRWATRTEQNINQRKRKTNTSGYTGVSWSNGSEKWRASVTYKGKRKHLGAFDTAYEAAEFRDAYIWANNLPHKLNIEVA